MAVNKNFVIKNGLEVGTDLIIAPTDVNKVGIGSTVPNAKLVVGGDLYATDVKFTGIGTVEGVFDVGINGSALNVNPSTGVIGINTDTPSSTAAVDIRGQVEIADDLDVAGVGTIATLNATDGTIDTFTAVNVNVTGVITAASYFGDGSTLDNTGATLSAASGTQRVILSSLVSGVMTTAASDGELTYVSSTDTLNASKFNGSYLGTLNNAGVSTIGIITGASSIQVTDVYASTLYGNGANLTGIDTSGNFSGEYISAQGLVAANPGVVTAVSYDGTHANFTGVVTATSFVGDGSNLTNTGSTLGTGSGVERVVMTSLTSGTMTSSDTDPNLVYDFDNDRFGIGTTNPATLLHISGTVPRIQLTDSDTGVDHQINASSSVGSLAINCDINAEGSSPSLQFGVGGSERARIDSSGNVGIGTDDPQKTLEVGGSGATIRINDPDAGANVYGEITSTNSSNGALTFTSRGGSSTNGGYTFETTDGTTTNSLVTFKGDGKVGINKVSPSSRLDVGGTVTAIAYVGSLTNTLTAGSYLTGTSYNNSSAVTFAVDATTTNTGEKVVARDASGNFSAGTITASLSGTATNATNFNVAADNSTNATHYVIFTGGATGNQRPNSDTGMTYNPSTNTLTVAEVNGNAATATNADNAGLLDGLDSSSFLRADTTDSSSGKITFNAGIRLNDNDIAEFGSSADYTIKFDGSNTVHNAVAGDIYFQEAGTNKIRFDMSTGNIIPTTDNTGNVGTSANTWSSGRFTNFTVDSTLTVRGAIDLADSDILRFGSSDDVEFFFDGSQFYLDLNSGGNNFIIRDGTTTRFTFDDAGDFSATRNIFGSNLNASGNIEATGTGYVGTGQGAGGAFLTINDGGGNANVTFNHRDSVADQDGNAFRMSGNTDATSNARLIFEVYENITTGNDDGVGGTVLSLDVSSGTKSATISGSTTISGNLTVSGSIDNDSLVTTGKAIAMAMIFGG